MLEDHHDYLFLDGFCGLCNRSANFMKSRLIDGKKINFYPINSVHAQDRIKMFPLYQQNVDTVYLIRNGRSYIRSSAAIRCLLYLKWYYSIWFYILWLIPFPIRDIGYIFISKIRYKIFPKVDSCSFGND